MGGPKVFAARIDNTDRIARVGAAAVKDVSAENPGMARLYPHSRFAVDSNCWRESYVRLCGIQLVSARSKSGSMLLTGQCRRFKKAGRLPKLSRAA